ncbi:sialic acid-binding lectin-like [Hyperolius riggenbachi]|uniref:sialic acid-binding lectin-like n=1 Tax=Hyperolius riggenbachi TaxID=752182 RepID=UPI0035A2DAAA
MSPKLSILLIFGIVLGFPNLSSCQNWSTFQQKHIRPSSISCKTEMNQSLFYVSGNCKTVNTFILASASTVQAICSGTTGNQLVTSPTTFTLNDCRYQSGSPGSCVHGFQSFTSKICITCENKLPVHFAKSTVC